MVGFMLLKAHSGCYTENKDGYRYRLAGGWGGKSWEEAALPGEMEEAPVLAGKDQGWEGKGQVGRGLSTSSLLLDLPFLGCQPL